MARDLLKILKEVRGTGAPEASYTDGIYWELTEKLHNGNPGVYGDILSMYSASLGFSADYNAFVSSYNTFLADYSDILVAYADIQSIQAAVDVSRDTTAANALASATSATESEASNVSAEAFNVTAGVSADEANASKVAAKVSEDEANDAKAVTFNLRDDTTAIRNAADVIKGETNSIKDATEGIRVATAVINTDTEAIKVATGVIRDSAEDSRRESEYYAVYPEDIVIPGSSDLSSLHYAHKSGASASSAAASASTSISEASAAAASANSILSMTASVGTLIAGSSATASYNSGTGVMNFGIPKGDKGATGDAFTVNAQGAVADLQNYNSQPKGFTYLSTDEVPNNVYFKLSNDDENNWSDPNPFGQGEKGDPGVSITDISLTSGSTQPGELDTYTITYTDASTTTYQVYNGTNGTGFTGGSHDEATGITTFTSGDGLGFSTTDLRSDMVKATYDNSGTDGRVDDADKVNGLTVETAVPASALFTDTVYDDSTLQGEVDLNTAKVTNYDQTKSDIDALGVNAATVNNLTVETAVPTNALFTDTPYDATAIQAEVDLNTAKVTNYDQTKSDIDALGINSTTVNSLTVETAVPAGAVFTDTTYSIQDGELSEVSFTSADNTKLDDIEASATRDQTGAEIKSLYEDEANAYTDTLNTKLAGIETAATADQTDAEIKTAYESNGDTNAYSDSEQVTNNKLDNLAVQSVVFNADGTITIEV